MGYVSERRWREGQIFELPENCIKVMPDGSRVLPKWVEPIEEQVTQPKPKRTAQRRAEVETSEDEVI
jgi:hypothetical protein